MTSEISPATIAIEKPPLPFTQQELDAFCDEAQSKCPICQSKIQTLAFADPCRHAFCLCCIMEWMKCVMDDPRCPMCRQSVVKLIHLIFSPTEYSTFQLPKPRKQIIPPRFFRQLLESAASPPPRYSIFASDADYDNNHYVYTVNPESMAGPSIIFGSPPVQQSEEIIIDDDEPEILFAHISTPDPLNAAAYPLPLQPLDEFDQSISDVSFEDDHESNVTFPFTSTTSSDNYENEPGPSAPSASSSNRTASSWPPSFAEEFWDDPFADQEEDEDLVMITEMKPRPTPELIDLCDDDDDENDATRTN